MNKTHILTLAIALTVGMAASAQSYDFAFTSKAKSGIKVTSATTYDAERGYGYDITPAWDGKSTTPFYFSVKLPDGNYRVNVTLGSPRRAAKTMVRAENRRLMAEQTATAKGKTTTLTFTVNKRTTSYTYTDKNGTHEGKVKIKERERDYFTWDDKLTLEFNGDAPAITSLSIERDTTARAVFLCGNSTVVDQFNEPYTSWGQMVTRWFDPSVVVCNHAESGLTARTFIASNRLDQVLSQLRSGDYVVCEFGHNDEKEHRAGDGAWYHYTYLLKTFVDRVRAAGGNIIFCTPTARRRFDDATHTKIENTHGEFPAAMKAVADREQVPLIDLTSMSTAFYEALGYEGSKQALVFYPAGTYPGQSKDLADNTHFNPYGAYEIAKMVVQGLHDVDSELAKHIRADWTPFTPSEPDGSDVLLWKRSAVTDVTKPDGN